MESEEWRRTDVPGYEISNKGRVRFSRIIDGFDNGQGYKKVVLYEGNKKNYRSISRLVCEAFNGPCPDGMLVRHLDGSRDNDVPSNLAWGTPLENSHDKWEHGTMANGEKTGRSKITEDEVKHIRGAAWTTKKLAEHYGLSTQQIYAIRSKQAWKHVSG